MAPVVLGREAIEVLEVLGRVRRDKARATDAAVRLIGAMMQSVVDGDRGIIAWSSKASRRSQSQ